MDEEASRVFADILGQQRPQYEFEPFKAHAIQVDALDELLDDRRVKC